MGSELYSVSCSDLCSTENESTSWILSVLASLLQRLVARNERSLLSSEKKIPNKNACVFSAMEIPAMDIHKYLERIFKYARCSPSAFIVAYTYIDRLILNNPGFLLTSINIHRLVITSVMVATKFLDDLHYTNDYFAKVGGLTIGEINILEVEFLFMLNFRLQVTVSVYDSYCSHLQREVALDGGFQIERPLFCFSKKELDYKSSRRQGERSKKQRLALCSRYAGC